MSIPKESFHIRLLSIFLGRFAPKGGDKNMFSSIFISSSHSHRSIYPFVSL